MRFQNWDDHLLLIDKEILDLVPDGTVLYSISGKRKVKGKDPIDLDTRGGFLAYGFLHNPESNKAAGKQEGSNV